MEIVCSYKISSDLYLVRHRIDQKETPKKIDVPTNHFLIIDCSGSMSYDLPKIREQLKKKLPKLLKEKDTITIIWFSGRGQFGTLLEAEPVATLADLKDVERAIDRWLKPIGLTGFQEPIEEAGKVLDRVSKKHPKNVGSLLFLSDGCDNQGTRSKILDTVSLVSRKFSSSTFVEYGYYADRPLLTAMAEKSGGTLIFAEDFDRYAPTFESAIQKKLSGAPRIEVKLTETPVEGFAFARSDGDLLTFAVTENTIQVPADLPCISYLTKSPKDEVTDLGMGSLLQTLSLGIIAKEHSDPKSKVSADEQPIRDAYAALSLYAIRMKSNIVFPLLKALGDIKFIDQFSTCFGKQAYSAFQEVTKEAAFDEKKQWEKGWDPNKVPAEDAFTILELMQLLASDENNRVLLDHSSFKYNRIGRGRIDASDQITADEQKEIQELTVKLATEKKASKAKEISDRIAEITNKKTLKFEADPAPDGYPISSLTFNEDRPNVSFLVRKAGTVDLSAWIPETLQGKLPAKFPTFVYRNYAVIKDGLVNIDVLPVRIKENTYKEILSKTSTEVINSAVADSQGFVDTVLNLRLLPVINRKMIKDVSAKTFFQIKYTLIQAQAEQKVFNSYSKDLLPDKKSKSFSTQYGDEATEWLKELGFTDYSGFSPKSIQAEAVDFYMGKELKVNLKGLSSLPSLNELRKQIAKGKTNTAGSLMVPTFNLVEGFLTNDIYKNAADKDAVLKAWLEGQTKAAKTKTRALIYQIAQTVFVLTVGQIWFKEFATLDDNSLDIDVAGTTIPCKAELREIKIKI